MIGGPAEPRGHELLDGDLHGIARLGPIDEDGPGNRVDLGEVELADIGYGRVATELLPEIEAFEMDRLPAPWRARWDVKSRFQPKW